MSERDPGFPYTEERDGITRRCLPVEDFEAGLYIHPMSVVVLAVTNAWEESGVETRYYVGAQDFMEVQRERDQLKRTLALVNATRVTAVVVRDNERLRRIYHLCEQAGLSADDARATASLIDWAKGGDSG